MKKIEIINFVEVEDISKIIRFLEFIKEYNSGIST